ncbi:peroxiredoxin [Desulfonatronum thioautotrophicum]|uniref:peroxiredoxin n=1 Tax=Desulfonatronum thioautotrophicum TaxID=617001 RepID=UPI000A9D7D88|nr:peroxiredoxin [Desulfonatronum thioautotrophicum]
MRPLHPLKFMVQTTLLIGITWMVFLAGAAFASPSQDFAGQVYQPQHLTPIDSELNVRVGDQAPDFTLPATQGETITLSDFQGQKNVMLSFVPAAWTPVCSDQWPGYNILQDIFDAHETIILGITVDNIPTLHSWIAAMGGLWFPVLSDFWPHGHTAEVYGLLRSDGTTERALIFVDKQGVIRFTHVEDINIRPPLEIVMEGLQALGDPAP